jgi:hypothetical protein
VNEIGKLYSLIDKSGRIRYPIFDDKRIFIRYLGAHEIILIVKKNRYNLNSVGCHRGARGLRGR